MPLPAPLQAGCVSLMEAVLAEPPCNDGPQYEVRRLLALCTLGLVAGGQGRVEERSSSDCI